MSLLQMSFSGGVLILAVIVLRTLTLHRLPKGTFLALWAVAVLRLLLPFSVPSPASVYTLAERIPARESMETAVQTPAPADTVIPIAPVGVIAPEVSSGTVTPPPASAAPAVDVWGLVWLIGALLCAGVFLLSYLRSCRTFRATLSVEESWVPAWLGRHRLRRPVAIRQSASTSVPLTYGVLRPVILLPEAQREERRLEWVLEHEFVHIQHFDSVGKLILAAAACVHWFNPLVWVMLTLANRDMELRCDEAVVRRLGLERRGDYARALIDLEEQKSGLGPFASAFNRSAIEERILAIMKMKKRSIAAILAAVALVCCVGIGFATSAAAKTETPYPKAPDGTFTEAELDRLAQLWFEGYEDMTVAAYQQKMWSEWDTPEDIALIDRYGQSSAVDAIWNEPETVTPSMAFHDYFHYVYEPLTAERWQAWMSPGVEMARLEDGSRASLEYTCTMRILDPETLTAGTYRQARADVEAGVQALLGSADPTAADFTALSRRLSTKALEITVEAGLPVRSYSPDADSEKGVRVETGDGYVHVPYGELGQWRDTVNGYRYYDPDAALHAQSSRETAASWDEVLSPYVPLGLTYQFYDPDLDGNGLTMWFGGKEVRGIYDDHEYIWITEHAGNSTYSDGAVELVTVYTDGKLSGLRFAAPDEQARFDEDRKQATIFLGIATLHDPEAGEVREFPHATEEDYASLLNLRTDKTYQMSLENFNQRVLNWANANGDAWDRINCDVIWNDYDVQLSTEEWTFVSLTCFLSGTENGRMIRALHTGNPEEDPGFSASLSEWFKEENGIVTAWCDLYYDISYHISDKSKATVAERDACVSGMMRAISTFWQSTDCDALLQMTEEDVVAQFNLWVAENNTENITFNPVTVDDISFEAYSEPHIN